MDERLKVMLVGPSFHFMSGVSVYTCRVANALVEKHDVGVVLLDALVPERLYPGGARVGQQLATLDYDPQVRVAARIDWWSAGDILRARRALRHERPDLLVLQWWTAATLHIFLAIAAAARREDIPVVVEFHEVQDAGADEVSFVDSYTSTMVPRLLRCCVGALVRSQHDHEALRAAYGAEVVSRLAVEVVPHGPYDHLSPTAAVPTAEDDDGITRLLFFGTIRPAKGLEDLIAVFNRLTPEQAATFRLTVVGETWEGWTGPGELIGQSPHRDRITFVNHYVTDQEVAVFVGDADVMVVPARSGSASGALQIAMSAGLNVVMYAAAGLVAAVEDYDGAVLVPADDLDGLEAALLGIRERRDRRYDDPHSWDETVAAVERLAAGASRPLS